jgi:histidyl-tRNA synthetase
MISLLVELYRRLGLLDLTLEVNSIGDRRCRPAYVQALVAYLRQHESDLSPTDRDRLSRNPLRVLDSKDAESQRVIEGAPDILDFLCGDCRAHWDKLRHGLDLLGIAHRVNPHLVRGLDYYNRTVFEFLSPAGGAQAAVNGGGRYDPLSELIGGPPVPGIGFGLGIERVILELMDRNIEVPPSPGPAVYAASVGSGTEDVALQKAYELRQSDIPVAMSFGQRRMKAQLGQADSLGARLAAIVGEDELRDGCITLRQLDTREQRAVPADELAQAVTEDLARTD